MSIELSRECRHAILAMAYLARQRPGRFVPIREVEGSVNVPGPFLAKILTRLAHNGLVSTRRGPLGGVTLSRRPGEICLGEVVRILDGAHDKRACYLGLPYCDEDNPCPVHVVWRRERDNMERAMYDRTLEDLREIPLGQGGKTRVRKTRKGRTRC